jgi:hypothetical protein
VIGHIITKKHVKYINTLMNSLSNDRLKHYLSFKQIGCHSLTPSRIISIDENKGALLVGLGASFFRKAPRSFMPTTSYPSCSVTENQGKGASV